MSKANLFDREVVANKSPRNVFDLSYSSIFSSPVGLILPAYIEDVKSGDKLKLSASSVCRTRPVNTSAFMAFDQRVDFWYVPYYLIWSSYEQWRLSQSFPHSTSSLHNVGDQYLLPCTTFNSVYNALSGISAVSSSPDAVSGNPDVGFALRMLDMCNYFAINTPQYSQFSWLDELSDFEILGSRINSVTSALDTSGLRMNYFRLAAYQCVYMHGYRNQEYEKLDPSYYNCDSLFLKDNKSPLPNNSTVVPNPVISTPLYLSGNNNSGAVDSICFNKLFTPRYKNWRRDLFTSLKPSSGFDTLTSPLIPGFGSPGNSGSSFAWPTSVSELEVVDGNYVNYFGGDGTSQTSANPFQRLSSDNGEVVLYAQNIYNLLAQDKFSRSMIYADKNYKDQMKAIFGDYADDDLHEPLLLGSYSCDVSISDIVATSAGNDGDTANVSSSVLGEIAGKGYGNNTNHVFERQFDKDGIVIGMHYIMPRNNYDSYRTNRFNTKVSRFDYFYPQFDGLGLQPCFAYERNLFSTGTSSEIPASSLSSLLGFSPRYVEYKTRQSETHGSFMSGQPDYDWTLSNNSFGITSASDPTNYKIMPDITDRLFSVAYNGSIQTDPFICYFSFNVDKISNMEVFGTPSL